MSSTNPPDPFSWFPAARPTESSIPDLLKNIPYAPTNSLPPEVLKHAEAILNRSQPSSPSAPPKSLAENLKRHVEFGRRLLRENKLTKSSAVSWVARLRVFLQSIFTLGTPFMKNLDGLKKSWAATAPGTEEFSERLTLTTDLVDFLEQTAGIPSGCAFSRASRPPETKNVFIIHGKDELNARRLADYLREDEAVTPVVMMARPSLSRPLTDKFEDEASKCSFAFALFTPDDLVSSGTDEYQQARPNVVYETGWFIGRLGKHRVTLLLQSGAEMHTDLQGVSRIHFQQDVREKFQEIRRELKAIGLI